MNLRGKLTYANVMATIAVFIALGGTGYAAAKINGKNIKSSTVSGKALKKDTLAGREIKESKLGKVPSALTADRALTTPSAAFATAAASADKVGGTSVTPINLTAPATSSPTTTVLYTLGALKMQGSCSEADDFPTLTVKSSANNGYAAGYRVSVSGTELFHTFDNDLDANETAPMANSPIGFSTYYTETLRNADGSSATVLVTASKQSATPDPGYNCKYTGVAFGY
jgi:hypothetical protein